MRLPEWIGLSAGSVRATWERICQPAKGNANSGILSPMRSEHHIIRPDDRILVTGANGFIGSKVVEKLLSYGFRNLRCFMRAQNISDALRTAVESSDHGRTEIFRGDLLDAGDCEKAMHEVRVVYHLAAPMGEKSLMAAYRSAVEATRHLLDAASKANTLVRFVNVSSFAVYSNMGLRPGALLDESCPIEAEPHLRGEAYSYAKIKQEELIREYGGRYGIPYVIVRPGVVYGPGSGEIPGRVGVRVRGILLHLGGANVIPFTYVDNCAEAIVLAGVIRGLDGEAINVIDDGLLTSREFLKMYKANVGNIRSVFLPKVVSCSLFCLLGTILQACGRGSPSKYNLRRWSAYWKGNTYTNEKAKRLLGWSPKISIDEGMRRYFVYCRTLGGHDA